MVLWMRGEQVLLLCACTVCVIAFIRHNGGYDHVIIVEPHVCTQTDRQTNRKTDTNTDRQTQTQTNRKTDTNTDKQTNTGRQTNIQKDRHKQTDRCLLLVACEL